MAQNAEKPADARRRARRSLLHKMESTLQTSGRIKSRRLLGAFHKTLQTEAASTIQQIERMQDRVRSLKYDEQAKARKAPSAAAVVADAAKWRECSEVEETRADYLIPRKSLTSKLYLRMFDPSLEFRDETFRQLDQHSKDILVADWNYIRRQHPDIRAKVADRLRIEHEPLLRYISGSNPVLAWKSDQTLLNRTKPEQFESTMKGVKRTTSRTKEIVYERENETLPTWDDSTPRTWDDDNTGRGLAPAETQD